MNEQTNKWMNKQMNEWTNKQMNEWTDQWMNESMNKWMNILMNKWMYQHFYLVSEVFEVKCQATVLAFVSWPCFTKQSVQVFFYVDRNPWDVFWC